MPAELVNGMDTGGWDPNIGFIMTHGLGLEPPARDTATGHFKWYGTPYADLPDVCKCPAMPPSLLTMNPELDQRQPLESLVYNYALAYQTSGTCRAATRVLTLKTLFVPGAGGRNPPIPDPTSSRGADPTDNCQFGTPIVWVYPHKVGAAPDDPAHETNEVMCSIQAVGPAEVQSPGRVFYLSDSRDYRPYVNRDGSPGWPPAGKNAGYLIGGGNEVYLGSRHFGYANVMYLDGRVNRDNQVHEPEWNLDYDWTTGQARSSQWRAATFATDISPANIRGQMHMMPVLMVKGWEYFFDANGLKAR